MKNVYFVSILSSILIFTTLANFIQKYKPTIVEGFPIYLSNDGSFLITKQGNESQQRFGKDDKVELYLYKDSDPFTFDQFKKNMENAYRESIYSFLLSSNDGSISVIKTEKRTLIYQNGRKIGQIGGGEKAEYLNHDGSVLITSKYIQGKAFSYIYKNGKKVAQIDGYAEFLNNDGSVIVTSHGYKTLIYHNENLFAQIDGWPELFSNDGSIVVTTYPTNDHSKSFVYHNGRKLYELIGKPHRLSQDGSTLITSLVFSPRSYKKPFPKKPYIIYKNGKEIARTSPIIRYLSDDGSMWVTEKSDSSDCHYKIYKVYKNGKLIKKFNKAYYIDFRKNGSIFAVILPKNGKIQTLLYKEDIKIAQIDGFLDLFSNDGSIMMTDESNIVYYYGKYIAQIDGWPYFISNNNSILVSKIHEEDTDDKSAIYSISELIQSAK